MTTPAQPSTTLDIVEELRWNRQEVRASSIEEFERQWREEWVRPGTRNHQVHGDTMSREVRRDEIDLSDDNAQTVAFLIVGRTIVGFERTPDSGQSWGTGENDITITLDDESRLRLVGWGHDASGLDATYCPATKNSES